MGGAQGFAFATDVSNALWRVNLANASATLIGVVGTGGTIIESIGITPGGALYAADTNGNLWQVNTTNANASLVGNTQLGNIEGMDWDPARGAMLVTDFSFTPGLWSLNLANAAATNITTATSNGIVRSLSVNGGPAGPIPYDVRLDNAGQGGNHGFYDSTTGAMGFVGGVTTQILATDRGHDGNLYGLDFQGNLHRINPANGALTLIGNAVQNDFFLGMATDPIPEPASLLALAAGTALLARRRRKA